VETKANDDHRHPPSLYRATAITDGAYDGLLPDQQAKYARVKNGDQGGQWVARDQLAAEPGLNNQTPTGDKVRVGEMEVTQAELQEFFQSKADTELRKASLPATPADYAATLPESITLPPGVEVKFNEADPALADARAWAHKQGFSQAQFSEMLSLHASLQAREVAQFNAAHAAEVAKMGANGTMRVTAMETWLRGMVGDKLAGPMRGMMVTADIVKGLEILQQKFSRQGAATFSQSHREPGQTNGRVSEDQYQAMGPAKRLNYARSHDQSQFQKGN
jgi:hypothetical protein